MTSLSLPPATADILSLLVRLVLSVAFLLEVKLKLANEKRFAKADGIPVIVAWMVTLAELAAALGLSSGVLARPAAFGVMLLMLSTMSLHIIKWHSQYRAGRGGWEYDLLLFTLAAVILVYGPGKFVIQLAIPTQH